MSTLDSGRPSVARRRSASLLRRIVKPVLLVGLGFFVAIGLVVYFEIDAQLAPSLSREGLLNLRPGMTEAEVLALIGRPLWEKLGWGDYQPKCEPTRTWVYGQPGPWTLRGMNIIVVMECGRVLGVYAKDDFLAYACARESCEVLNASALNRLPARLARPNP